MSDNLPPGSDAAHVPSSLVLRLATRSLSRNRRRTLITISSIALGLFLAIVVKSISMGVYRQVINDAARAQTGHITVEDPAYRQTPSPEHAIKSVAAVVAAVRTLRGVVEVRPRIELRAVVATGAGSDSVTVIGESSLVERSSPTLAANLVEGTWPAPDDARGAALGVDLARRLHLTPGAKLVVTTNDVKGELQNELLFVRGIFRTGSMESDSSLVRVPLGVAQRIVALPDDQATQVAIVLSSYLDEPAAHAALEERLAGAHVAVHSWPEMLPELAGWIAIDTRVNAIERGILFLIIAFTILNTVLMSVIERHREFAILLALGTPKRLVRSQIAAETILLAGIGTVAGAVLGFAQAVWLEVHGIDLSSAFKNGPSFSGVSINPWVHAHITGANVAQLAAAVFITTALAGGYPVIRSTQLHIANSLRSR